VFHWRSLFMAAPGTSHPRPWDAHKAGCRAAAIAGFAVLQTGGDALDAVETAIVSMEDDPTFDAGLGAHLNQQGVV
jgi:beta-aspartyl-peptidase (threonine type)